MINTHYQNKQHNSKLARAGAAIGATLAAAPLVHAHPVSGSSTASLLVHLFTQPDHLAILGISIIAAAALYRTAATVSRGALALKVCGALCVASAFAFIATGL